MSDHGDHGPLALPHAGKGPKKGQGISQLKIRNIHNDTLLREKKAEASNNGTECASSIQSRMVPFPLAETNTCNDIVCPAGNNVMIEFIKNNHHSKLTVLLDHGDHGPLALPHAEEAPKKGRGDF